ncbi:MAG: hypothetical protein RL215_319 [Planctomycetota bacterium]|jgi:hypothetical protein
MVVASESSVCIALADLFFAGLLVDFGESGEFESGFAHFVEGELEFMEVFGLLSAGDGGLVCAEGFAVAFEEFEHFPELLFHAVGFTVPELHFIAPEGSFGFPCSMILVHIGVEGRGHDVLLGRTVMSLVMS